jgi:hypothetical protein
LTFRTDSDSRLQSERVKITKMRPVVWCFQFSLVVHWCKLIVLNFECELMETAKLTFSLAHAVV